MTEPESGFIKYPPGIHNSNSIDLQDSFIPSYPDTIFSNPQYSPSPPRLFIKIPKVMANAPLTGLRRSGRHRTVSESVGPSGSEYHESDKSMEMHDGEGGPPPVEFPKVEYSLTQRGRRVTKKSYIESQSEDDIVPADDLFKDDDDVVKEPAHYSDNDDEDDDDLQPRYLRRSTRSRAKLNGFIVSDDEGKAVVGNRYPTRNRSKKPPPRRNTPPRSSMSQRSRRMKRRNARLDQEEHDVYVDQPSSGASVDADGSLDDAVHTSSDAEADAEADADADADMDADGEVDHEPEADGKPYALRQRAKINYAIPPPLEEMPKPSKPSRGARSGYHGGGGGGAKSGGKSKGLGWSATGAELGRWMGMGGDDSDSDYGTRTPRKSFGAAAGGAYGGAVAAGGMLPNDLAAAAGTPSNLGKIGDSALADADPLGTNTNVTFDEVGGLDDHIHSLKEMTLLPLLYPEVFQKFNVTPPRGVLFHGPPGTGKTLLARALAASCRTNGKQISFFMRKGADCLSKWVGEAERQLRLLFEEAKNCQPSIIFFDEIDGLAPVRSSKQDQIHASIVSTLLALMDGMDGRGQVVVIGATNRPDAIDPALRRPGRFDREFYFPLPGLEGREKILSIMTKGWEGWNGDKGLDNVKGLAKLTKGYGGADLRALCTEAALNAVQRRYPQIYKSTDRLLLSPDTISVGLRDFMISIKKLVPSSARSSSSSAVPLPPQFAPLLSNALEEVKTVIGKVLPVEKKLTALQEAEFEDNDGEEGALEREMMMQSMETLRIYRPRMVLHGRVGMGQAYVAAAALHHLEGYHIQSLELGALMSDSTRSVEAGIVQLFVEAKRHQPSVIYIPSLLGWCAAVSETSRSTVRAMLETLAPTDPILLLAIVDGEFSELPRDVKNWFGPTRENRVQLTSPNIRQREEFFEGLIKDIQRPPNLFADGVKRRKRILEELPIAPPIEPRQPTAAELAVQEENDQRVITLLKYRLGPILTELKRKFKRFTKRATEEYNFDPDELTAPLIGATTTTATVEMHNIANGVIEIVDEVHLIQPIVNGHVEDPHPDQQQQQQQQAQLPTPPPLFDMDLEKMHTELYKGKYLVPQDFLDDVGKIVHNAHVRQHEDIERFYRAQAMFTATQVSIHDFDPQLRLECERMAVRERKRRQEHKKQKEKGKANEDGQNGPGAFLQGPRRSARTNGQQPEISITDPLKLERRLKRQRGEAVADSQTASEEENGQDHVSKRPKISVAEDGPDPMDIVGPSPERPRLVVHFAADDGASTGDVPDTNGNHLDLNSMVVDEPPRKRGFDSFLLNPLSPSDDPFLETSSTKPQPLTSSILDSGPHDPFFLQSVPQTISTDPTQNRASLLRSPVPRASRSPIPASEPTPPPAQKVIERSPTPPHPDFHYDDNLLSQLKGDLCTTTSSLTVEQLEQLRATSLGCVWRHRSQWDRDELIHELMHVVAEFIDEVAADSEDSDSSPQ